MAKLVLFEDNWADEFDVCGIRIFSDAAYTAWISEVEHLFVEGNIPAEMYFGTNEYIEYDNFDHWKKSITAIDIAEDEVATINKLLQPGRYGYGIFLDPIDHLDEVI